MKPWLLIFLVWAFARPMFPQFQQSPRMNVPEKTKELSAFIPHVIEMDFMDVGAICTSDLDGDGDLDLAGTSGSPGAIAWWENLDVGSGSFFKRIIDNSFKDAYGIVAADFDGDSAPDLLAGTYFEYEVAWFVNMHPDSFPRRPIETDLRWPQSVFASDMDGDGDTDALAGSKGEGSIIWFENDGSGSFTKHFVTESFTSVNSIFAADMDGDGDTDVLGINSSQVAWWENDGSENFTMHNLGGGFSLGCFVMAADLDKDGDMDILTADKYGKKIDWWANDGTQAFSATTLDADIGRPSWLDVADLDNDGDNDVLAASSTDRYICIYENLGSGNFEKTIIHENLYGASFVSSADLDGDGDLDVIGASGSLNDVLWLENTLLTPNEPVDPQLVTVPDTVVFIIGPEDPTACEDSIIIRNTGSGTLNIREISWEASWITHIDTMNFLVAPGVERVLIISCDAKGLLNGTYENSLQIYSNDPGSPESEWPVRLEMKQGREVHYIQEKEPNNTKMEAQPIHGPAPSGVRGSISVSDRGDISIQGDDLEDLYSFQLQSGYLKSYLFNTSADLDMYLLQIEGTSITIRGSNHRGSVTDEIYEIDDLEPGTYYIGVSIYDDHPLEDSSSYDLVLVGDLYTPADETAPVITIISPVENHEYESSNVPLEWSIEEPDLMDAWYSMDHGLTISWVAQSGDTILEMENGVYCVTLYAEDHSGNAARDSVNFTVNTPSTAIQSAVTTIRFYEVFPNPVIDHLNITSIDHLAFSVDIISTDGRPVYRENIAQGNRRINLSSFQRGVYFVTIRSEKMVVTEKIIKL